MKKFELSKDISLLLQDGIDLETISVVSRVSLRTLKYIIKEEVEPSDNTLELLYSYMYRKGICLNQAKEELFKDKFPLALFHGSKSGLKDITSTGSRSNCDFGKGFYLGESYMGALEFVHETPGSSVYAFTLDPRDLKIVNVPCSLEWMIIICYFRGFLSEYLESKYLKYCLSIINDADVIVAPIADNKMFYVMKQFAEGLITSEQAIYSLSASSLGKQYVIKSDKALTKLTLVENLYVSKPERDDAREKSRNHAEKIDTKLKLARREFRNEGKFVDEILK